MSKQPRVFLTRPILPAGIDILEARTRVTIFREDRRITKRELIEQAGNIHALLCMLTDPIDAEVMAAAPRLRVISTYAVGYDNIDVAEAKKRGIVVTNTPGVLTETTAETAFALMIACGRRIVESDRWLRAHDFDGWAPMLFLGQDLHHKTLGIAGFGRIGKALARRAALGFHMRILYQDPVPDPQAEKELGAEQVSKEELFRRSDFLSLHLPLTPESRHYAGAPELALMKPSACLINTARGPVVDEGALIAALREKRIFSAGLDVFEEEPAIPEELRALENVVILPHIGSGSVETRTRMAVMAAENILSVLAGREPVSRVV